jgi:hypothetical protein
MKLDQLKELVRQVVREEEDYQQLFKHMLDKSGKSIPSMSDDDKKKFFNAVDTAYKAKSEGRLRGYNENLPGNQEKLDTDKDGEIEASDLAALRASKNESINEDIKSDISKFLDKLNKEFPEQEYTTDFKGGKYARILQQSRKYSGNRSAWGFVAMEDNPSKGFKKGDLLKAAGFNTPAKGARGNILDGTEKYDKYSPIYLKESINEEEIKWNAVENAIINFLKMNTKILDKRVKDKDTDGVKGGLQSIIDGLTNAQRSLNLK